MAKKRRIKKKVEEETCNAYEHHGCEMFLSKITGMAFVLFLITIWPWLNKVLLSIHWGIYLGIAILLMIIPIAKCCKKK